MADTLGATCWSDYRPSFLVGVMMMNWANRLLTKMLMGMQKGAASTMQEELKAIQDELLKGTFDPQKIAEFVKGMGIDMGQFSQMFSGMASSGTMPQGFDPYVVLGLDKSASDDEVKHRYRELIRKLHPDTAGVEGTSFLLQMVLAAEKLIEKERGWQ